MTCMQQYRDYSGLNPFSVSPPNPPHSFTKPFIQHHLTLPPASLNPPYTLPTPAIHPPYTLRNPFCTPVGGNVTLFPAIILNIEVSSRLKKNYTRHSKQLSPQILWAPGFGFQIPSSG